VVSSISSFDNVNPLFRNFPFIINAINFGLPKMYRLHNRLGV
jgi:hypothetical protein